MSNEGSITQNIFKMDITDKTMQSIAADTNTNTSIIDTLFDIRSYLTNLNNNTYYKKFYYNNSDLSALKINEPKTQDLSSIIFLDISNTDSTIDEINIAININYICSIEFKQRISFYFYLENISNNNNISISFKDLGTYNSSGNQGYNGNFSYNWIINKNTINKNTINKNTINIDNILDNDNNFPNHLKFYMSYSIEDNNIHENKNFSNNSGTINLGINDISLYARLVSNILNSIQS